MKKLLFTLFMFISIFSFGVCAYAATISDCDVNIESGIMTVTGKLDKACKVGIHVHNSSGELVYMNDTYAGDDSLQFEFKMIISSEISEVYTVKIGGEGANVVEKKAEFIISDKKEFLNFSIAGNRGIINGNNNTIKVTVSGNSLRNLTAEFAVSDMATVWIGDVPQESGVTKNDFDSDVVYTVIAEDGSKRDYTVEVTRKKESSSSSGGGGGSKGSSKVIPVDALIPGESTAVPEAAASAEHFTDLDEALWAKEWIYYLYGQGVVSGVTESTFEPQRSVKREEFVKMLVLSLGEDVQNGESTFEDVDSAMWYCGYINTAVEKGIVNGVSPERFGVGDEITREDMAVMLYRAFGNKAFETESSDVTFTDEALISGYAKEAVAAMAKSGIINGKAEGVFEPKHSATRAEAAKLIGKLMSMK